MISCWQLQVTFSFFSMMLHLLGAFFRWEKHLRFIMPFAFGLRFCRSLLGLIPNMSEQHVPACTASALFVQRVMKYKPCRSIVAPCWYLKNEILIVAYFPALRKSVGDWRLTDLELSIGCWFSQQTWLYLPAKHWFNPPIKLASAASPFIKSGHFPKA